MARNNTQRLIALKSFLGSEGEGFIRRGQAFDTTPNGARSYLGNGLAAEIPPRPTAAEAARATEDDKRQKQAAAERRAARAAEDKDTGRGGATERGRK